MIRCLNYQAIFDPIIPEKTITIIRGMANKSLVLGNDKFMTQIETRLKRRIKAKLRGGDRKLEKFKRKEQIK